MKNNKGFTLVELLAVIVILAVILIIAVPKVMDTIENTRNASFESTAKLIVAKAEEKVMENETLNINEDMACDNLVKLNDKDYSNCVISVTDDNIKVSLYCKGKFAGKKIENATKTDVKVSPFYGDVNLDGNITNVDITVIRAYIGGKIELNETAKLCADINKDNVINDLDLDLLREMYANKS